MNFNELNRQELNRQLDADPLVRRDIYDFVRNEPRYVSLADSDALQRFNLDMRIIRD